MQYCRSPTLIIPQNCGGMITFCPTPIPVIVEENKEGYLLYVESGGTLENDIWTCVLCGGGLVRHYLTSQVRIHKNSTFNIKKAETK